MQKILNSEAATFWRKQCVAHVFANSNFCVIVSVVLERKSISLLLTSSGVNVKLPSVCCFQYFESFPPNRSSLPASFPFALFTRKIKYDDVSRDDDLINRPQSVGDEMS